MDLYIDIYIYIAYNIDRIYLQMLHFLDSMSHIIYTECSSYTLPETNIFAENGWLEDDPFLLGLGLFSGVMLVFREGIFLVSHLYKNVAEVPSLCKECEDSEGPQNLAENGTGSLPKS